MVSAIPGCPFFLVRDTGLAGAIYVLGFLQSGGYANLCALASQISWYEILTFVLLLQILKVVFHSGGACGVKYLANALVVSRAE